MRETFSASLIGLAAATCACAATVDDPLSSYPARPHDRAVLGEPLRRSPPTRALQTPADPTRATGRQPGSSLRQKR